LGSAIRARPIATICCSPPESVPAFCFKRSRIRGKVSKTVARVSSTNARLRWRYAPSWRFSSTVMSGNSLRFSGTIETPRFTTSVVDRPETTSPSSRTWPDDGETYPRIVFNVVVFPLALPPSRHTISPGKISMSTSRRTETRP
jgi:hypothetical protein